jgi:hypothetical protein
LREAVIVVVFIKVSEIQFVEIDLVVISFKHKLRALDLEQSQSWENSSHCDGVGLQHQLLIRISEETLVEFYHTDFIIASKV